MYKDFKQKQIKSGDSIIDKNDGEMVGRVPIPQFRSIEPQAGFTVHLI
jgi:hypothetical protein